MLSSMFLEKKKQLLHFGFDLFHPLAEASVYTNQPYPNKPLEERQNGI